MSEYPICTTCGKPTDSYGHGPGVCDRTALFSNPPAPLIDEEFREKLFGAAIIGGFLFSMLRPIIHEATKPPKPMTRKAEERARKAVRAAFAEATKPPAKKPKPTTPPPEKPN